MLPFGMWEIESGNIYPASAYAKHILPDDGANAQNQHKGANTMNEKITQEMADDFNAKMVLDGSAYRVIKCEGNTYAWEITTLPDPYEDHRPTIYPNERFYGLLESHFAPIKLHYNNTRSTFWSL